MNERAKLLKRSEQGVSRRPAGRANHMIYMVLPRTIILCVTVYMYVMVCFFSLDASSVVSFMVHCIF
jgi:hypothetical protein